METFSFADILIPQVEDMSKWAVIACDQFTSQPEYWDRVERDVGQAPSALRLILPEVELGHGDGEHITRINEAMLEYLHRGIFREYQDAFVYVERTLHSGKIRRGLVGKLDLEQYDYGEKAVTPVRATEKTVVERIPPRKRIRENAALELPHVLLLCDDEDEQIIEPMRLQKAALPTLYEFDLMEDGGHIRGWLVEGLVAKKLRQRLVVYEQRAREKFADLEGHPMLYAVGDGNHSLATAKACWEDLKARDPGLAQTEHPARFALVELENLHDEAQQITPIHRILKHVDPEALLQAAEAEICAPGGYALSWIAGEKRGTLTLDPAQGQLPVGILQNFLDRYLAEHPGQIDYIHEDEALCALAQEENAIGFLLPAIGKNQLFRGIIADGVLPRKTFSMGHATEKRYYLEARKIR